MPGSFSPIAETQIGAVAYLFGILNSGSPISMTGLVSFETESDDQTLTWTEKENSDTTGNTQNITQHNHKYERSIKFNPSGASRTAAAAVVDTVMATNSDGSSPTVVWYKIVVANHKAASFNGTYRIKPGIKASLKMADNADIDFSCERMVNAAQNLLLTNAPIAG